MYDIIEMKSIAKELNNRTFTDYYYRLMLMARSVFEWKGLPKHIDEKWIEKYLFTEGKCVFYKDDTLGLMVARITENGPLNEYDEPTTVRPYATNYTGRDLTNNEECVIIRNNDCMLPTAPTIQLYAMKLANIDRTIDVNINSMKMPIIIKCTERQKLSLKKVMSQRNENEPIIWASKEIDTEGIEVLKTDSPIVFKDLQLQKNMVWNECMTFLGVNNANQDKRERLVDDEVQANNEQVEASFNIMLKARRKAAEQINKLFGTDISVEKRIDYKEVLKHSERLPEGSDKGSEEGSVA